jgi:hypothetical protein
MLSTKVDASIIRQPRRAHRRTIATAASAASKMKELTGGRRGDIKAEDLQDHQEQIGASRSTSMWPRRHIVGDGIAPCCVDNAMARRVSVPARRVGIALNLKRERRRIASASSRRSEGDFPSNGRAASSRCRRRGGLRTRLAALGQPIDGKGPLARTSSHPSSASRPASWTGSR